MSRQSLEFLGIIEALEGIHVLEIALGHAIAGKLLAGNTRPVYESVDHEVLIVARMAGNSLHQLRVSITPLSTEFGHAHPLRPIQERHAMNQVLSPQIRRNFAHHVAGKHQDVAQALLQKDLGVVEKGVTGFGIQRLNPFEHFAVRIEMKLRIPVDIDGASHNRVTMLVVNDEILVVNAQVLHSRSNRPVDMQPMMRERFLGELVVPLKQSAPNNHVLAPFVGQGLHQANPHIMKTW